MSGKFNALLAACAIVSLGLALAAPAVAADRTFSVIGAREGTPTRFVGYADLNLARIEGEKTLFSRVRHAVNDVCLESVGDDWTRRFEGRNCRDNSYQGAQPQVERALQRARDIAANGSSAIAPVAITISAF